MARYESETSRRYLVSTVRYSERGETQIERGGKERGREGVVPYVERPRGAARGDEEDPL